MDQPLTSQAPSLLPPEAALAMPDQKLNRRFRDPRAPGAPGRSMHWRRGAVLAATLALTAGFSSEMAAILSENGMTALEYAMTALFALNFLWIALALINAFIGLTLSFARRDDRPSGPTGPLDVALLMPIYNEEPGRVMANATAMLAALQAVGPGIPADIVAPFLVTPDPWVASATTDALGRIGDGVAQDALAMVIASLPTLR